MSTSEWYTPSPLVEEARQLMGGIDLDPTSCAWANDNIVKATEYWTKDDDMLAQSIYRIRGRVWFNPPYTRDCKGAGPYVAKLVRAHERGLCTQACTLLNHSMNSNWWRPLDAYPFVNFHNRVAFHDANGIQQDSPRYDNVLFYMGEKVDEFAHRFEKFGNIYLPYRG